MPDDDVRLEAALSQGGQDGEARCHEGRLLHLGMHEVVDWRVEAEALEIETRGLRADSVHLPGGGERLRDLASHARLERALAGEAKGNLAHVALPFVVHSISDEPHVRPAPIPVINTSAPSRSRPSARASVSASGIDPDEVFP